MSAAKLTLRVTRFSLAADDPITAAMALKYGQLHVLADVIELAGCVTWPAGDLTLCSRLIIARHDATLDVSGRAALPDFDPERDDASLDGSPDEPDGKAGADGGAGNPGGCVTIVCERIDGSLTITARGSNGGNGQRGGNGVKPKRPDGVDGAFLGRHGDPEKGTYGGGVLQGRGLQWYVAWAQGQPGGDARNGGSAGTSGCGGAGGDGGTIRVTVADHDSLQLSLDTAPGQPGAAGAVAAPGAAGDPGVGGRNRICHIHIDALFRDIARQAFVGEQDADANAYARKHGIPARARSGKAGATDGAVAQPPTPATMGRAGVATLVRQMNPAEASLFDLPYVELLMSRAERDLEASAPERAAARLAWVERITTLRAASDDRFAAPRERAREALARIETAPPTPS